MTPLKKLAGDVGIATAGNLIGRAANVLIPLAVVGACGVNRQTDSFFLILAVAFFFYGTLANAISDVSVPLLISGRLAFSRIHIFLSGIFATLVILPIAGLCHLFLTQFSWHYVFALAALSGAGIANGLASGRRLAEERFAIPGITWSLRLLPLVFFIAADPPASALAWLAIGIGLADWLRLVILAGYAGSPSPDVSVSGFNSIFSAFPAYGLVLAASAIMGLNPVIDRLIARISGPGSISILEAAERAYSILATLCTIGISSVLLTHFSKAVNQGSMLRQWKKVVQFVLLLSMLWMCAGIALGWWGLAVYLDHIASLSINQADMVKQTYWCYLVGLPLVVFVLVYTKHLQALQKWWAMLVSAVLGVGLNIPMSLLLRQWMGVPGIALATTLVYSLVLVFLVLATHLRAKK